MKKRSSNLYHFLWNYMRKSKGLVCGAIICGLLSGLLSLLGPLFIGKATDCLIGVNAVNFSDTLKNILLLAGIYLCSAVFLWLMNIFANALAYKTSDLLRRDAYFHLMHLPLHYIDSTPQGDTISRLTNDVDFICEGMLQSVSQLLTGIIIIIGSFAFMLALSPLIALIVLLITPLSFAIAYFITKHSRKMFKLQTQCTGKLTGITEEMIGNQSVVKSFSYEDHAIAAFEQADAELYECGQKAQYYSSLTNPTTRLVNNISYVLVGVIGSLMALQQKLSVGTILSFLTYATQFAKPINEITGVVSQLQSALASLERISALLQEPTESEDKHLALIDPKNIKGDIIFEHIAFSYLPEKPLITDFSFHAEAGSTIAIVGPTGAGKTTLVNLLLRFYDVTQGRILIDGIDITTLQRDNLRDCFAMVLQETWLFKGTIRDNIAYGKENASDEEIIAAAKKAHAHSFIMRLPDAYKTVIAENGTNLSQGERQLLTIARAMLLDPPVLILDEATSSVDTRTEQKIQKAFLAAMENRTSFVIAHRLSTIQNADVIIVMKNGNIEEFGSHNVLISRGGLYAELYNSQFSK